jgi:hypothetical protein
MSFPWGELQRPDYCSSPPIGRDFGRFYPRADTPASNFYAGMGTPENSPLFRQAGGDATDTAGPRGLDRVPEATHVPAGQLRDDELIEGRHLGLPARVELQLHAPLLKPHRIARQRVTWLDGRPPALEEG